MTQIIVIAHDAANEIGWNHVNRGVSIGMVLRLRLHVVHRTQESSHQDDMMGAHVDDKGGSIHLISPFFSCFSKVEADDDMMMAFLRR